MQLTQEQLRVLLTAHGKLAVYTAQDVLREIFQKECGTQADVEKHPKYKDWQVLEELEKSEEWNNKIPRGSGNPTAARRAVEKVLCGD